MLFIEKKLFLRMEGGVFGFNFYWTWRDFGLLPTYPFKGSNSM